MFFAKFRFLFPDSYMLYRISDNINDKYMCAQAEATLLRSNKICLTMHSTHTFIYRLQQLAWNINNLMDVFLISCLICMYDTCWGNLHVFHMLIKLCSWLQFLFSNIASLLLIFFFKLDFRAPGYDVFFSVRYESHMPILL